MKKKKKMKEECSGSCKADTEDVFAEGLNNSRCSDILFNCVKELEAKVVKIYEVVNTAKESQIKGKKELEDSASSVCYITKKFDEHEEERKKKDDKIKCLQERLSFLENKNGEIEQ